MALFDFRFGKKKADLHTEGKRALELGEREDGAKQFRELCLAKALVAHKLNIPLKGISSEGLLIDWDALLAMEITPDLICRYLTVLAAPGKTADDPRCEAFLEKTEKLPEAKKKEFRELLAQRLKK
jgi:hypothetical protein